VMQSKALLMAAVLLLGGFGSVFADEYHGDGGHGNPADKLGNFCGEYNDTFISLDLHPGGGLPGDRTNATVTADYTKTDGSLPKAIFEPMYSYVTFAWYRPSTGNWIADPSGGIWYDPASGSMTPVTPRPTPNNKLITTWSDDGVGTATVNRFPVPNITVSNLLPGEEIWLVACFAHPMPNGGRMDMNYTVAEYQVSICHTERDREMQIVAPATGMPGENIPVTVTVYLNKGDRPEGWRLIRLAWIDESGNPVVGPPFVDVVGTLTSGTVDPDTGRLTTSGTLEATGTLTVPDLPPGTHLSILACTGHPMGQMYNRETGNGYHSFDFTVGGFMVVPEMIIGSIGLVGAALGSFMLYARRKQV
jgi:hypothetical protein